MAPKLAMLKSPACDSTRKFDDSDSESDTLEMGPAYVPASADPPGPKRARPTPRPTTVTPTPTVALQERPPIAQDTQLAKASAKASAGAELNVASPHDASTLVERRDVGSTVRGVV